MAKGNRKPVQTPEFKAKQFKPVSDLPDEKLAPKPLAVKVGGSVYQAVVGLPQKEKINWLRRVITEAARQELMGGEG
ncbi:MAG: hypothetical protein HC851_11580 [Acaryochloris sp. RU_4_1]|nr:hypothetical protein [Acaryochloris sp. RU_4_1]NJR54863.1 hypothetical protein [Acaryochloris sp. CRU_2_0]